jgi:hypothetical protein
MTEWLIEQRAKGYERRRFVRVGHAALDQRYGDAGIRVAKQFDVVDGAIGGPEFKFDTMFGKNLAVTLTDSLVGATFRPGSHDNCARRQRPGETQGKDNEGDGGERCYDQRPVCALWLLGE